jgi:hypothetical protein
MGYSPYGPYAFYSRSIAPPYPVTFLSTDLIKARIDLGWVFLITPEFSFPDPRQKYPLACCGQK